jgi:hypothetical protein
MRFHANNNLSVRTPTKGKGKQIPHVGVLTDNFQKLKPEDFRNYLFRKKV